MKNAIKKISIVVLLLSIIFSFMSCGGGPILLPEQGQIPDETVFEEQLGVLPEEAEELMDEVDKIEEGFGQFNPFNNNDSRGILNGTENYYMGTMRFGPYPYFRKYNLEVIRLQFEQIFNFDNIQGSMLVKYYVSDEYLGHDVEENEILLHTKFLASFNVEASGEQGLVFDSDVSAGAKEILKAINESIQEKRKVEVYVYAITTYNHFNDQLTVVAQNPTLILTVDLNLETSNENPTITKISGPDEDTTNNKSEFSWDGNDPDGNINEYIVSKDGVTKRTKNKSVVWAGYSEGQHVFKVKGIDNRGGVSNELNWTFTYHSEQKPTVQKVSGPGEEINEDSATFEWTGSDNAGARAIVKYQYKKDTGVWTDMNPLMGTSYTWTAFNEGAHTFSVRAKNDGDVLSNVVIWNFTFTEEELEPATYVLNLQSDPTVGGDIQIESQGWKDSDTITVEEGSQVQIQAQVSEGYQFDGWYNGETKVSTANPYTLTVNSDQNLTGEFTESPNEAPTVQKVSGPSAQISENNTNFEWTGSDSVGARAIVKYQYKKDGGTWIDMSPLTGTTYTWSGISEGSHLFSVRAKDDEDALSNTISWNFTYTEPDPDPTHYVLNLQSDPTVGGDIQIDNQGWKDSDTITVEEGSQVQIQAQVSEGYQFDGWYNGGTKLSTANPYTLTVNSDQNLTGKFTEIPNEAPSVQKVSGPGAEISENSATFQWTGSDNVGTRAIVKYQYKKDTDAWTDMNPVTATSYTWSSISEGTHTFSVRAKDDEDALSNVISWNFTYSQETQEIVYRALLIGIENYDGDNDLDYTYDDVIDIQTIMNNQNYNYQIEKMGGSQQVTKAQLLSKLNEYVNDPSIDSDDVLFFGYSGHGAYGSGTSYLVSSDLLAVTVSEIRAKLDQIPGTKIVSIDACQSGAFVNISGMRMDNKMNQRLAREYFVQDIMNTFSTEKGSRGVFETEYEYYAMAAAAIDEYSWESSGIENGFYTFFLADGVGHNGLGNPLGAFNSTYNADANGNHSITLSELYNYVSTNVYSLTVSYDVQTVQVYPSNSQYVLFEY